MGNMGLSTRGNFLLTLLVSLVAQTATPAHAAEWVIWDAPDALFSETLLKALDATHNDLPLTTEPLALAPESTKCVVHVKRPTFGEDPISNPANAIECQLVAEDGPILTRLDL